MGTIPYTILLYFLFLPFCHTCLIISVDLYPDTLAVLPCNFIVRLLSSCFRTPLVLIEYGKPTLNRSVELFRTLSQHVIAFHLKMSFNPFILVTPGATRGLGLALTRQFLRTTTLPVFATTRTNGDLAVVRKTILDSMEDVRPERLNLIRLDLTSEESIASAADELAKSLKHQHLDNAYIHSAFITGGILKPERRPADLTWQVLKDTFQINVISHLLIIKHFSRFLPKTKQTNNNGVDRPSKWVHISARVGSIEDNRQGGWYSYRSSKSALNQVVKTFDLHLQQKKIPAICVAMHPGTVKTDLSKDFLRAVPNNKVFEPQDAAVNVMNVVENLKTDQRGKLWDWSGRQIPW